MKLTKQLLLLLAVSVFSLAFINFLYKNRLEIVFDAPSVNFFQVFYPVGDSFAASSTDRHLYPGGKNLRALFVHQQPGFEQLRLDPFEGTSSMVLKSMTMSDFFYSSSVSGEDMFRRIKAVQMLEDPRMRADGIVLNGTSYDPILVVDLKNIDRSFNYKNVAIWAVVSILGFLLCQGARREGNGSGSRPLQILLIALGFSLAVVLVFYPGFMTYDSFHALRAARSEVTESVWPPMVSYAWRLVDLVSEDPAAMLFAQLLLFFFCLILLIHFFTHRLWLAIGLTVLLCAVPSLLGTIGSIWKDVLMAGFLLAAILLAFHANQTGSARKTVTYFVLSTVLMLLASSTRHNAITAVIPIALYAGWALVRKLSATNGVRSLAIAGMVGTVTLVSVYGGKLFFDKYSIPELRSIDGTGNFMPVVRGMDLFAASLCLDQNLLQEHSPRLSLEDISRHFDPRHSNNSLKVFQKIDRLGSVDFNRIWWQTLREHPVCALSNKFLLAKYALGASFEEQFLLISPVVDLNEFGYFLPYSSLRNAVVKYAHIVSNLFFMRPWVFFFLSFPAMAFIALRGNQRIEHFVLFSSSMLYALGFFMFGNAADGRLLFYSTALNVIVVCLAVTMYFSKSRKQTTVTSRT